MVIDNKSGDILCYGFNTKTYNPFMHGEIRAISNCSEIYEDKINWSSTTLLTTAEPCPMCASAIIWSQISTVVYGTSI